MKDREAPFSPSYVHLRSHVITRCFLSAKVVELILVVILFNFSHNVMQTELMAPNCQVSFI